jgi:adenosylcobinamide-GDP ribazoletransferase
MQAAEALRAGAAAVTFLTRIPLRRGPVLDAADVARGAVLFPVVGAAVGAAGGGAAALAHPQLPALAAAAIAIGIEFVLTGGLHLDALADTADAAGAPTRERALEIMRDPRIGSFGAVALVVDLLARAAAIAALLAAGGALSALVVAGALGRATALPLAAGLPYARASGGPGSVLTGRVGWVSALAAGVLALGAALSLRGVDGLAATGAAVATAALLAVLFRRWLGGVTGDTLGAVTELSGTVVLLTLVALA